MARARSAEADLARAMTSAASELDAVGKGTLDEALAARQRLAGTLAQMRAAVAGVTADLEAAALDLWEDMSTEAFVPPAVWAAAAAPPAIAELSANGSQMGGAPPISPDGDQQQHQPEAAEQPADLPAEAEPAFLAVSPSDAAPPLPAAREELVLTAAACPPVEAPPAQRDDGKPAGRPRGKRRRGKG
jgi:hypothetical protein